MMAKIDRKKPPALKTPKEARTHRLSVVGMGSLSGQAHCLVGACMSVNTKGLPLLSNA
jgi:hypothetical protein